MIHREEIVRNSRGRKVAEELEELAELTGNQLINTILVELICQIKGMRARYLSFSIGQVRARKLPPEWGE
jgi:hypothetical protein